MNKRLSYPYVMAITSLISYSGLSFAKECNEPEPPSGPCIECTVKFDNPAQLLAARRKGFLSNLVLWKTI
ncbi:MAG TPA: hypothetical protein ENG03_12530 [Thioploca sp.]|nr:hypothetical protein [Thioploca sp.]